MTVLVKALIAFVLGALACFVAGLILNHFWSVLVGIIVGLAFFFSYDTTPRNRF